MKIEFVGDVITQPLSPLRKIVGLGEVDIDHHGIDQHFQVLMSSSQPDVLISHAAPEFFFKGDSHGTPHQFMANYCTAIADFANRQRSLVVVNTLYLAKNRFVAVDHFEKLKCIGSLNAQLWDCAIANPLVAVADVAGVVAHRGIDQAISRHNDLVMRMPYTRQVLPGLISEYARVIRERMAARKKVLLLDADNTLWGGVVGEDGIDGIAIGDGFPGSVYWRFQQSLVDLRASGILLALVTKNNEADVREAFDRRDMPLKWSSFAATRANWLSKTDNIGSIAEELNVGADSMVFIDDNPFEIERVRSVYPSIECVRFNGQNADHALNIAYHLSDISAWSLTEEDISKSDQYRQEKLRNNLKSNTKSLEQYLTSLDIKIEVGINRVSQIKRITQLVNKTNQFNLTTRRYSESQLLTVMEEGHVFDFRLSDRFGDMGIVGVLIIRDGEIENFLVSCRALGRNAERAMLQYCCRVTSARPLRAAYLPTPKNGLAANFYDDNGFALESEKSGQKFYTLNGSDRVSTDLEVIEVIDG